MTHELSPVATSKEKAESRRADDQQTDDLFPRALLKKRHQDDENKTSKSAHEPATVSRSTSSEPKQAEEDGERVPLRKRRK